MDLRSNTAVKFRPHLQEHLVEVFARYGKTSVEFAYFLTGSEDLAQDLSQEAFVRLLGRWPHLRRPEAVQAYLNRTIVNLARSHFRRRKREREYLQRHTGNDKVSPTSSELDDKRDMFDLLQQLPPRQRAALILRFYFDLTEGQTADALGSSTKAVNGLVQRGLRTLRERSEVTS